MPYNSFDDFKTSAGYEIDGTWYPRVTSILSIKSKDALYRYYASMPSYAAAEAMKERSAEEGTLLHETVESILSGDSPAIHNSISASVGAFKEFLLAHQVNPIKVEERILSKKHRYAGTIDVLAEIDGVLGVLDIKTSTGIYRDYGMQTAAYIEALQEAGSPPLTSWILRLDQHRICNLCQATLREKGGTAKVRKEKYPCRHDWSLPQGHYEFKEVANFDHNIKAFLAAKTLWEWEYHDHLQKLK